MGKITAPILLNSEHNTTDFDCGNETLNEWLKKRALKNQNSGASRTFVICTEDAHIIGYYALASGSVERLESPKSIARNMPKAIPVAILGRLAIHTECHRKRLGSALLKDAMLRTLSISQNIGIRALLVHAISDNAKNFYIKYGFQESPIDPMTLMLSLRNIANNIN
ncbi:GNAT family N-acetyltransferase [Piscirickettsiaceae bacterium NZ-RLO2]|nr:GNAT family N-acetyltransferase [Piscirickettsiaceae bacterium NZ-RLO2]